VLWHVAVLQPLNAVVVVLDGLLIGAGDLRFLARAMVGATAVFGVAAFVVWQRDLGLGWLWAAIGLFMATRGLPLWRRWTSGRWAVVGAPAR
jgi:Na+-driven multidrug efflux pump